MKNAFLLDNYVYFMKVGLTLLLYSYILLRESITCGVRRWGMRLIVASADINSNGPFIK